MNGRDLVKRFEQFAPTSLAESWDTVGSQVGDLSRPVHKIMTTLDVRPETVQEAIEGHVDFIFAHHPLMFRPIKRMDLANPQNQMVADLIKHEITVYAAHTNLDSADGGMNDWLAEAMGLLDVQGLVNGTVEPKYLLTVHVPNIYADAVRLAMREANAGRSEKYSGASFQYNGHSRFTPQNGAAPYVGTIGEQNEMEETSIEVKVEANHLAEVLQVMTEVHPFEEPAYTLVQLANEGHQYQMGRVGNLAQPTTVEAFARQLKDVFHVPALRVITADPTAPVSRVAVLGGSGGEFYAEAKRAGADVYVTGDVSYHVGHDIKAVGLSVVDPGHHIEVICQDHLASMFASWANQNAWDVQIVTSQVSTEPFTFL